MIREIVTDYGIFGNFKDIEKYMKYECKEFVQVVSIKTWVNTDLDCFIGVYSYDDIKIINK